MGLEITEAFLNIERTFGIDIPDGEYTIRSVGDLYYVVLRLLDTPGDRYQCFTPYAFMKLRKPLQTLTGRPKADIRPETKLAEVFPWRSRRRMWDALTEGSGLRLPKLDAAIPDGLILFVAVAVGMALGGATVVAAADFLEQFHLPTWLLIGLGIPLAIVTVVGMAVVLPVVAESLLQRQFPGRAVTLLDLVKVTRKQNYGYMTANGSMVSGGEVWLKIRDIVSQASGVAPDRVTPEALLVEELGMG